MGRTAAYDAIADWYDPQAVIIRPGYLDGHWTGAWTDRGVRDEVGATARKQAAVSLPAGRGRA